MKYRLLNLGLIFSTLIGYLEWGTDSRMFLIEMEQEVLLKLFSDPSSVLHPLVLLPLFGQVLLAFTLFQKKPGKLITFIAIGCLATLFLVMFLVGCISLNFSILLSTLPFLLMAMLSIWYYRKEKSKKKAL